MITVLIVLYIATALAFFATCLHHMSQTREGQPPAGTFLLLALTSFVWPLFVISYMLEKS